MHTSVQYVSILSLESTHHYYLYSVLVPGAFVYLEMSFFPSTLVPLPSSLCMASTAYVLSFRMVFEKKLNASRPSEHPPVRGKNVKTFRWDHR